MALLPISANLWLFTFLCFPCIAQSIDIQQTAWPGARDIFSSLPLFCLWRAHGGYDDGDDKKQQKFGETQDKKSR
jgi:hypothetical protein